MPSTINFPVRHGLQFFNGLLAPHSAIASLGLTLRPPVQKFPRKMFHEMLVPGDKWRVGAVNYVEKQSGVLDSEGIGELRDPLGGTAWGWIAEWR